MGFRGWFLCLECPPTSSLFWIIQGLIPSVASRTPSESVRTLVVACGKKFHPKQAYEKKKMEVLVHNPKGQVILFTGRLTNSSTVSIFLLSKSWLCLLL